MSPSGKESRRKFIDCEGKRVSEELGTTERSALKCDKERVKEQKLRETIKLIDLPFSKLGLHGRKRETSALNECLSRLLNTEGKTGGTRELVWIHGESGTGKSALAATLEKPVRRAKGLFLRTKFDFNARYVPFSALSLLCSQAYWRMKSLKSSTEKNDTSPGSIEPAELRLLEEILHNLPDTAGAKSSFKQKNAGRKGKDSLTSALGKSFRAINNIFPTLVIVLDDMQWADVASLDFVKRLISDRDIPSLMIVGSYRSDETAQVLSKLKQDLQARKDDGLVMTSIQVGNLDQGVISSILMELLNVCDETRVFPLAQLCHKRTLGNAYFFLAFVMMLKDEGLLKYNLGVLSWCWNLMDIETETSATLNVVGMLKGKMKKLDEETSIVLQFAACLGSSFTRTMLFLIWEKYSGDPRSDGKDEATFDVLLKTCIEGRFLEAVGQEEESFRFVHDQVQEAAMSLITAPKFNMLQYDIGVTLARELDVEEVEQHIFLITNLQNRHMLKRSRIAALNLRAAEKANSMSAFESAAAYVSKGIEHLNGKTWSQKHLDLSLRLFSLGAEVEFSTGNRDKAAAYCHEVIEQKDISVLRKCRAYCVLVDIHRTDAVSSSFEDDASKLALNVLDRLGCTFPTNRVTRAFYVSVTSQKITRALPTITDISSMPCMSDRIKLACMKLMSKIISPTIAPSKASRLMLMVSIRMIQWTLRRGICDESALAFAVFASFQGHQFGNVQLAKELSEISLSMIGKGMNLLECQIRYIVHFYIDSWSNPLHSVDKRLMKNYKEGMVVGNLESAIHCSLGSVCVAFLRGKDLRSVEQDLSIYATQAFDLGQIISYNSVLPWWQAIHNLIGLSESTTNLSGHVMKEDCLMREQSNEFLLSSCLALKCLLCVFFSEYELGARLAIAKGDEMEGMGILHPACLFDTFSRSICLYATARKGRNRKYAHEADRLRSRVQSWKCTGRNPNAKHLLKLLDAEHKALHQKWDKAFSLYQEAIVLSARFGYLQHAALANERYAEALLEASADASRGDEAKYRLEQAIKYYGEWGAKKKVDMLRGFHIALR